MSSVGRAWSCGLLVLITGCFFDGSGTPGTVGPGGEPDAAVEVDAPDAAIAPDAEVEPPDAVPQPPAGYLPLRGMAGRYRAVSVLRTLDDAAADCLDDGTGAGLLVIDDADEDDAVRGLADETLAGGQIWIAITDLDDEGTWMTLDDQPVAYLHWNGGEPNDANDEDCVVLLGLDDPPGHRGRWNDTDCDDLRPYVCEWSID